MKLEVTFPEDFKHLVHGDRIVQIGSCFSTHMSAKLRNAGFAVLDNPYGVIFHPIALAQFIEDAIKGTVPSMILNREDVYLNYMASSSVYDFSEPDLIKKCSALQQNFLTELKGAKLLTITFGSAHGYRLKDSDILVANCHQQPQSNFTKECTDLALMVEVWKETISLIRQVNPDIQLITTVSPVRYFRDGWIENNRSKARLLQLCESLESEKCIYFPSYEIIIDELRDYRFFEVDGSHPNELAINYVWDVFQDQLFDKKTKEIVMELMQLRSMENHKVLFPNSLAAERFQKSLKTKRESFLSLYPVVVW